MRNSSDSRRLFAWMIGFLGALRPTKTGPLPYPKRDVERPSEHSRDTVEGCLERAAADLRDADTATDSHERKQLRMGAKRWSLRADMLERLAKSFRKRADLDEASRQFHRDKARQGTRP